MSNNTELTKREHEVAALLAAGRTNHEIAGQLDISVKTVDTHRGHILQKLGVKNNALLTHYAIANGWVPLQFVVQAQTAPEPVAQP